MKFSTTIISIVGFAALSLAKSSGDKQRDAMCGECLKYKTSCLSVRKTGHNTYEIRLLTDILNFRPTCASTITARPATTIATSRLAVGRDGARRSAATQDAEE